MFVHSLLKSSTLYLMQLPLRSWDATMYSIWSQRLQLVMILPFIPIMPNVDKNAVLYCIWKCKIMTNWRRTQYFVLRIYQYFKFKDTNHQNHAFLTFLRPPHIKSIILVVATVACRVVLIIRTRLSMSLTADKRNINKRGKVHCPLVVYSHEYTVHSLSTYQGRLKIMLLSYSGS